MGYQTRQAQVKRLAMLSSMQARRPFTRTAKASKDIQVKAKRLMREMLVFWKKNEREERDVRRREQKEATDRAKVEEEKREAARQARKLEFLISQTELYSHFVGNKLKSKWVNPLSFAVLIIPCSRGNARGWRRRTIDSSRGFGWGCGSVSAPGYQL
jgi:DNA helicase INO80